MIGLEKEKTCPKQILLMRASFGFVLAVAYCVCKSALRASPKRSPNLLVRIVTLAQPILLLLGVSYAAGRTS